MFEIIKRTVITDYITRLDCVEIESIPEDTFIIKAMKEKIDGEEVEVKLMRNNDDLFLSIEQEFYPKFLIRNKQNSLELLMELDTLNIGIEGL